jgi:DNA-binding transcriptional regulator GbsR (MarR family)
VNPTTATLVDGLGAAAAASGILTQLQARIFALLYMEARPLSLDEIAAELQQSKSNVSLNIRVLVEWHLARRKPVAGSRRDHYEAATDFFRTLQEIFERRFRWTVRQVLGAVREAEVEAEKQRPTTREARARQVEARERLRRLQVFFGLIDAGIAAFVRGEPFPAQELRKVVPLTPGRSSPS